MATGTGNLPNQNMDFVPLATLPASDLDKLVENIESLADGSGIGDGAVTDAKRPRMKSCIVNRDTQTVSNASEGSISFDTEILDTDNMWASTNPTKVFVPEAGLYMVNASILWSNSAGGDLRYARIQRFNSSDAGQNVVEQRNSQAFDGSYGFSTNASYITTASAGDYFMLKCYQNSGGSLTVASSLQVVKLSD